MKRSKGPRSKTRKKISKSVREHGMPPVTHALRSFEEGDQVAIVINSAIHGGQPHHRFHGLTGTVTGTQGGAYQVTVRDGGKMKTAIVRPEHLRAA